jgi:O-antigen ligase
MILARERARPEEAREWARITLVLLLIAGPAVAIAPSKPKPTDQAILFRGAAGDANTMGHVTSLAFLALILIRERAGPDHPLRGASLIALTVLGGLLLATKARSSAFSVAVGLYIALAYLPRLRRTLVGVVVLGTIALVAAGSLEDTLKGFIFKEHYTPLAAGAGSGSEEGAWARIFATRIPQWTRAWNAFWKRPVLGWGFGASETTPPEWKFSFQAVGRLEDVNNDFLQVGEGVGILGLLFHVALILMVLIEGRPPRGCKNFEWIAVYCLSWALWANFMLDGASQAIGFLTAGLLWILLSLTACPALQEGYAAQRLVFRPR